MPRGISILGYANEIGKIHTWYSAPENNGNNAKRHNSFIWFVFMMFGLRMHLFFFFRTFILEKNNRSQHIDKHGHGKTNGMAWQWMISENSNVKRRYCCKEKWDWTVKSKMKTVNLIAFSKIAIKLAENKAIFIIANATELSTSKHSSQFQSIEKTEDTPMFPKKLPEPPQLKEHPPSVDSSDGEDDVIPAHSKDRIERLSKYGSKLALQTPGGSTQNFDLQVSISYMSKCPFNTPLLILLIRNDS